MHSFAVLSTRLPNSVGNLCSLLRILKSLSVSLRGITHPLELGYVNANFPFKSEFEADTDGNFSDSASCDAGLLGRPTANFT
jgi:hypothetical protein